LIRAAGYGSLSMDNPEVNDWAMYYGFAKTFGYTPKQVDETPVVLLTALAEFEKNQVEKEKSEMKRHG